MAYFGSVFTGYGNNDRHLRDLQTEANSTGIRVRIEPAAGFGGTYFGVWINSNFAGSILTTEDTLSDWASFPIRASGDLNIVVLHIGGNSMAEIQQVLREHYEETADHGTAQWTWQPDAIDTPDNEDMTNWTISGVLKSQLANTDIATRGMVAVTITESAGTATVVVGTLASGSGPVGSTVTLTALNSSGVTGTVDVGAGATTGTGTLYIRYPASMKIFREQTDPPTVEIADIAYNGANSYTWTDGAPLTSGTYYYALQSVSDTNDLGTRGASTALTVPVVPGAPTDLAYVSGTAAATVISWIASPTAGATYNIYVQGVGQEFMDTHNAFATAIAGSTGATLPAITGYPGKIQLLVRAELSGVEEKNGDVLVVEYDAAGAQIDGRPNAPEISTISVTNGTTLNITGTYNPDGEAGTPSLLQLFARIPSVPSYTFATPDASVSLGTVSEFGISKATILDTLTNGWHYVTLKTATASGTQSESFAAERLVYIDSANLAAPSGTFILSRG